MVLHPTRLCYKVLVGLQSFMQCNLTAFCHMLLTWTLLGTSLLNFRNLHQNLLLRGVKQKTGTMRMNKLEM